MRTIAYLRKMKSTTAYVEALVEQRRAALRTALALVRAEKGKALLAEALELDPPPMTRLEAIKTIQAELQCGNTYLRELLKS